MTDASCSPFFALFRRVTSATTGEQYRRSGAQRRWRRLARPALPHLRRLGDLPHCRSTRAAPCAPNALRRAESSSASSAVLAIASTARRPLGCARALPLAASSRGAVQSGVSFLRHGGLPRRAAPLKILGARALSWASSHPSLQLSMLGTCVPSLTRTVPTTIRSASPSARILSLLLQRDPPMNKATRRRRAFLLPPIRVSRPCRTPWRRLRRAFFRAIRAATISGGEMTLETGSADTEEVTVAWTASGPALDCRLSPEGKGVGGNDTCACDALRRSTKPRARGRCGSRNALLAEIRRRMMAPNATTVLSDGVDAFDHSLTGRRDAALAIHVCVGAVRKLRIQARC